MSKKYSEIDVDLQDLFGSTANIKIDKVVRKRLFNKVLDDLGLFANWSFAIRRINFNYLKDLGEYNVENYLGLTDYKAIKSLGGVAVIHEDDYEPQHVNGLKIRDKKFSGRGHSCFQRVADTMIDGVPYLLANLQASSTLQISGLDALTNEGTWSVVGDAINLAVDTQEYRQGNASLKFDIDVSEEVGNYAGITNSTINSIDLTDYAFASDFLLRTYLPESTDVESIELRIGSSSSAYYKMTTTVPINNTELEDGWNRVKLAFDNKTTVGVPDITSIVYAELRINYAAGYTDQQVARFDDLQLNKRFQLDMSYFSSFFAKSAAGVRQQYIVADTDVLVASNDVVNALEELTFYQMQRTTKSLKKADRDEAFLNYRAIRNRLRHRYGYAIKRGSRHVKTQR